MATITIRVHPYFNEWLEKISSQTGLTKTAIIIYAMNDTLRRDNGKNPLEAVEIVSNKEETPVRFTLRMPESLKNLAFRRAKESGLTMNALVTYCIYRAKTLYWSDYSFDEESQKRPD